MGFKTSAVTVGNRRTCIKCDNTFELEYFPFVNGPKAPKRYRGGTCRRCCTARAKASPSALAWASSKAAELVAQKRDLVNQLKSASCTDCGETYPPVVMDFDHVRGTKEHGIAQMVAQLWSVDRLMEELAKCDLVCANCHRLRTYADGGRVHIARVLEGRRAAGLPVGKVRKSYT